MQIFVRYRFPFLLAFALALAFVARPAQALTEAEAGRVVVVLETLQPDYGALAYDEDIAEDWFIRDAQERRFIPAQGFTAASWKTSLDATMRGYLASIPQAEIDALFAQMREKLGRAPKMTPEQRAAMSEWVDEKYAELKQLRLEGAAHVSAVRPYAARLRKLLPATPAPD